MSDEPLEANSNEPGHPVPVRELPPLDGGARSPAAKGPTLAATHTGVGTRHQHVEGMHCRWQWRRLGDVTLDHGRLVFPTVSDREGIYRFTMFDPDGRAEVYVGESSSLRKRFNQYRNADVAAQGTASTVEGDMYLPLIRGGRVTVHVITQALLVEHDGSELPLNLSSRYARRLVEAAVVVDLQKQGVFVTNVD